MPNFIKKLAKALGHMNTWRKAMETWQEYNAQQKLLNDKAKEAINTAYKALFVDGKEDEYLKKWEEYTIFTKQVEGLDAMLAKAKEAVRQTGQTFRDYVEKEKTKLTPAEYKDLVQSLKDMGW